MAAFFEAFGYELELITRLVLAALLGGVIGVERARTNHEAGLRTHLLVCLGAAGVMCLSEVMHGEFGGDIGRIGAQVVNGLGFLGAGCIIVSGNRIKGLTTAAGLWTTACVGLSIGMGYYFIAIPMVLIILVAMFALRPITSRLQKLHRKRIFSLKIKVVDRTCVNRIVDTINDHDCDITSAKVGDDGFVTVTLARTTEDTVDGLVGSLIKISKVQDVEIMDGVPKNENQ